MKKNKNPIFKKPLEDVIKVNLTMQSVQREISASLKLREINFDIVTSEKFKRAFDSTTELNKEKICLVLGGLRHKEVRSLIEKEKS